MTAERRIVRIDEDRCNGCGECIPACHEGALRIVDGKARLVEERYCDGLGECLGHCPQGAISIERREAGEFDEEAVRARQDGPAGPGAGAGCPGLAARDFSGSSPQSPASGGPSALRQWPVKLALVPPAAPYLRGADLLLCADCVPAALGSFHEDLLEGRVVLLGCPKLNDAGAYTEKLGGILRRNDVRSVTVAHMEVPCCLGLVFAAERALEDAGSELELIVREVSLGGELADAGAPGAEIPSRPAVEID